jgi:tellurite methyltransferase
MSNLLGQNIARLRKAKQLTQEELARRLSISFQAVSKWETGQSSPDVDTLTALAFLLDTDVNALLGCRYDARNVTLYEDAYRQDSYYWGVVPSAICYDILQLMPPVRRIRLLDVCCGEGRDSVFFARNGYDVTAFDVSDTGVEKTKRLAEMHNVPVNAFRADINDFRLDTDFDIIYSSGAFHYIRPELRDELIQNFQRHTATGGLNVFNVFVEKPFIPPPPENEQIASSGGQGSCSHPLCGLAAPRSAGVYFRVRFVGRGASSLH